MRAFSAASRLLDRYQQLVVGLFFGLLLIAGWRLAPDYGSYIDESSCRESGQISLTYLYECVPTGWLPARAAARLAAIPLRNRLAGYKDRDYGVAFELPMTMVEKASGYTAMYDVLHLRHRGVFSVCWGGCLAFYWLASRRLGSWRAGLLGVGLLLLSPRLFADFFYNAKDAVFLACFTIATATAVALVRRPSGRAAVWHALACAVAIDVRIMAVILPLLTGGLLGLRALHGDYAGAGRRVGRAALLYIGLLAVLVVVFWPYLWSAPAAHFIEALSSMSRFRWDGLLLYRGQLVPATALPWNYAPVWIGSTTPLLYLAGLVISLGLLGRQLLRQGWRLYGPDGEWQDLLFWSLLLGPLAAVAVLHSVLYDGWRQLYFVYAPLLLLALRGLVAAWRWQPARPALTPYWRAGVAATVAASGLTVGAKMVELHPLENLYFNALAGPHPEQRYEYDYWGLSLRQGMAWILVHDHRPLVRVQTNFPTNGIMDSYLTAPTEQGRLRVVRYAGPVDYFITTYRDHPGPYPFGPPVYALRVEKEGRRVFEVFRFAQPRDARQLLRD